MSETLLKTVGFMLSVPSDLIQTQFWWPLTSSNKLINIVTKEGHITQSSNCIIVGICRAIGVSNFLVSHLEQLKEDCSVVPHVNQVDFLKFSVNLSGFMKMYKPLFVHRQADLCAHVD